MARSTECPECASSNSGVDDSRNTTLPNGTVVRRRRRQCSDCQHRFTTYEISEFSMHEINAKLSAFEKLTAAMMKALPTEFRAPKKICAPAAHQTERK